MIVKDLNGIFRWDGFGFMDCHPSCQSSDFVSGEKSFIANIWKDGRVERATLQQRI